MELKSLVLGLFFSMGAFAVKSGAGMGYIMADGKKWPVQAGRAAVFAAGYGLVFLGAAWLVSHLDIPAHLDKFTFLLKSGMSLHFILAGLVMVWGVGLLRAKKHWDKDHGDKARPSKVWLALALPCPVCFTMILLSSGFLSALYPEKTGVWVWLYLGFVSLALAGAALVSRISRGRAEKVLGTLMIHISGYFFLTIILVPQWGDLGRVFRLSLPGPGQALPAQDGLAAMLILILGAFGIGFLRALKKEE